MAYSTTYPTRMSLLRRVQAEPGHDDWDEVLRYYEPFIRRVLARFGVDADHRDDVTQAALSRLWTELSQYRREEGRAKFRTWLVRLVRNVAIDDYRGRRHERRTERFDDVRCEHLLAPPPELELKIEDEWKRHLAEVALDRMDEIFSGAAIEVFLLSGEGKSPREISEHLKIGVDSVYVLKSRVKRRMIQEIATLRRTLEGAAGRHG